MSSLLQHNGPINERGVGLKFYVTDNGKCYGTERETIIGYSGRRVSVLYEAFRKPAGMWGCWVLFRYLGETHAPDLSVPIAVPAVPRGARRLTDTETRQYWAS